MTFDLLLYLPASIGMLSGTRYYRNLWFVVCKSIICCYIGDADHNDKVRYNVLCMTSAIHPQYMYIIIYRYIHTYIHTYMYVHIHTYICTYMYLHIGYSREFYTNWDKYQPRQLWLYLFWNF